MGVIVGFPVSERAEIDRKSGTDFARTMGFLRFLARMPLFVTRLAEGSMRHKGHELSQVLMGRS